MVENMAYVARAPCGDIVAAISDSGGIARRSHIASNVARWIRAGLIVEHVEGEEVRAAFTACEHPGSDSCSKCPKAKGQLGLEESDA